MGWGDSSKGWESGKGKRRGRKHAFKILCPDVLITTLMGPRGAAKEQLEEETGCKIIFSNRDEFFPGTYCRTLCIYTDEPETIVAVLDRIVDHVVACGEQELQNPPAKGEAEFIGKEEGTFLMRVAVSVRMSGAIIGPKGVNIQAIRDETNAKMFIDKHIHMGHQMLKIFAPPDMLKLALARVNDHVQMEAGTEEFAEWSAFRVFSEGGNKGWERSDKGKDHDKGGGKGKGKSKAPNGGKAALPDRPHEDASGRDRERSPRRAHPWSWQGGQQQQQQQQQQPQGGWQGEGAGEWGGSSPSGLSSDIDAGMLQALGATLEEFPEGTLAMDYVLTCELPTPKVSALIGKKGDHITEVRKVTGAKIHFDEDRQGEGDTQQMLLIQGPLLRVYKAHALMMKRYHDVEIEQAKPPPPAELPDVTQLQAQLQDLQRQLSMVQKLQESACSGGSKGKGKGKGKKG